MGYAIVKSLVRTLAVGALPTLAAAPALALAVPDYKTQVIAACAGTTSPVTAESYALSSQHASQNGCSTTAMSGTSPIPFVSAGGGNPLGVPKSFGYAYLEYFVGIDGPQGGSVPVRAQGGATVGANISDPQNTGYVSASARVAISGFGGLGIDRCLLLSTAMVGGCEPGASFSFDETRVLASGTILDVMLRVETWDVAAAVADPRFTIDPSFPDASLYHLVFSQGISQSGDVVSVAESSTLPLVLAGFAALGFAYHLPSVRQSRRDNPGKSLVATT